MKGARIDFRTDSYLLQKSQENTKKGTREPKKVEKLCSFCVVSM